MNEENKTNLENTSNNNEVLSNGGNLEVNNNENGDSINNIPLNEMEAPGTTLGVNPPSVNTEVNLNDNQVKPKNNKKKIIIIVSVVLGVILLAIIALFIYIKVTFNASKYLDQQLEKFKTSVTEVFNALNMNSNQDIKYTGTLKPTSNIEGFESLNDATIKFDAITSLKNNIIDINFDLLDDTTSALNGELYIDDKLFVLDSSLYTNPLYMDINNTSDVSWEELMDIINDAEYFVNGFATYLVTALKDTTLTTKIDGLTAKYTYKVDDTNKEAFAKRMNELITSDKRFNELLEEFLDQTNPEVNAENIEDLTFYIETSIPSGDVKVFFLVIDDETIFSGEELENGALRLYAGEEKIADITTNNDETTITMDMDNEGSLNLTYNNKTKEINGTIIFDTTTLKINSSKDGNNMLYEITLEDTYSDVFMEINANASASAINGYISIKNGAEEIKLDYDINTEYGNNLVSSKTFDNVQNINSLTYDQQAQIEANLQEALSVFFGELITTANQSEFLEIASTLIDDASSYVTYESLYGDFLVPINDGDTTCITIDELITEGYTTITNEYRGKIEITKNGNIYDYKISLTNGIYMLLNQDSTNITNSYLENYDSTRFTQEYYTCS